VKDIGYDPQTAVLEVGFRSGSVYRYVGVPRTVHEEFLGSQSKGQFLRQRISPVFRHLKIE
jgi:lysyl-tRNA synthetase class 2